MAIRREDQSLWERRAPLGPQHVRKLIKEGVKVIVQPSNRRAYPMQVIITIKVTKSLGITMRIGCAEHRRMIRMICERRREIGFTHDDKAAFCGGTRGPPARHTTWKRGAGRPQGANLQ